MADIKQAAKWMQEGETVHRKLWGKSKVKLHICDRYSSVHDDLERKADFTVIELLAEDWEIFE